MPGPFTVENPSAPGTISLLVDRFGNVRVSGSMVLMAQTQTPRPPEPGQIVVFVDSAGVLQSMDSSGTLTTLINANPQPFSNGFLAWNADPTNVGPFGLLNVGEVELLRVRVPTRSLVTNAHIFIDTVGSLLTVGQNFLGLYNSAGTRIAVSADQTTAFQVAGLVTAPFTAPVTITPGYYYVAVLCNGVNLPVILQSVGTTGTSINPINANLTAANARALAGPSPSITLPASINLAAQAMTLPGAYWVALS